MSSRDTQKTSGQTGTTSKARPYVAHEASYRQIMELKPNVAVLPWGATEAHNYHLPCGTDVIEANALGEEAVRQANENGARCLLLPCVPFGINHSQLTQFAVSMRASTQQIVLRDIVESLAYQKINRLILLNFHGGNDFKSMIRDLAFEVPVFVVQVHGFKLNPTARDMLTNKDGDHADEFETSLMLHLTPEWIDMSTANDGSVTKSELPVLSNTPGAWFVRNWKETTVSSGTGNPAASNAKTGEALLKSLVGPFAKMLVELSAAKEGQYPFILHEPIRPVSSSNDELA